MTPVTMMGSGGLGGPYTFTATGLPDGPDDVVCWSHLRDTDCERHL